MRVLFVMFVLALLGGCASQSAAPLQNRPAKLEEAAFAFNGRVAIRHDGESSSAGVRWTHHDQQDEILLLAPLGKTVARLQGDAHHVTLEADGKYYAAQDAESLTEQVLGWHLPMGGMRYWVLGVAAPGSIAEIELGDDGRTGVLRQDGWEIRYQRYATAAVDSLPLRMTLERDGMELRLVIDEWEAQ